MRGGSKASQHPPSHEAMLARADEAAGLMKMLAHRGRLLIVCRLVEGEAAIPELQELTSLSLSALSQHLAVLRDGGIVETRRNAQAMYYSLASGPARDVVAVLYREYCARDRF